MKLTVTKIEPVADGAPNWQVATVAAVFWPVAQFWDGEEAEQYVRLMEAAGRAGVARRYPVPEPSRN